MCHGLLLCCGYKLCLFRLYDFIKIIFRFTFSNTSVEEGEENMNAEKIKKLQQNAAQVRTGGKV